MFVYSRYKSNDMKVKKSTNTNMKFFYGSVFFFAIVILVILLFTYFVFRDVAIKEKSVQPVYQFTLGEGFCGHGCTIQLEDSVLYSAESVETGTFVMAQRYVAKEDNEDVLHFIPGSRLVVRVPGVDTLNMELGKDFFYRLELRDGCIAVEADTLANK